MSFYYMNKEEENTQQGEMPVYVDDTLRTGNNEIYVRRNKYEQTETGYFTEQEYYVKNLEQLKNQASFDEFRAMRHK